MLIALGACTSLQQLPATQSIGSFDGTVEEQSCFEWLLRLDAAVDTAGVGDAEALRLPGFPHLRVNRFLASFSDEIDSPEKWAAWIHRLERLGAERRFVEMANLPIAAPANKASDRAQAATHLRACGELLANADLRSPARLSVIRSLAIVPDNYSWLKRTIGIYPLLRIPFLSGVHDWQRETRDAFAQASAMTAVAGGWKGYAIVDRIDDVVQQPVAPHHSTLDALGIPVLDARTIQSLVRSHAPIFNVGSANPVDRFGELKIENHNAGPDERGSEVSVDIDAPAVYARQDFTRYGKLTLLQITYTLWFPERPADHAFDLLAGALDGVMVRITFSPDGEVVLVDSAHACGCYHLFFPAADATVRETISSLDEVAFAPAKLPMIEAGQRLRVWMAARTHYLVRVDAGPRPRVARPYAIRNDEAMITVRDESVGDVASSRSLYQPDGLVAGTQRTERFIFWPMGIASAGQMRQWGRHATAFVGRRHFDDARLIERYFELAFN
jgi:hypothetical protein